MPLASRVTRRIRRVPLARDFALSHELTLTHGNPRFTPAVMSGRVPLMGNRRALGDIGNAQAGTRGAAGKEGTKCVPFPTPPRAFSGASRGRRFSLLRSSRVVKRESRRGDAPF